MERLRYEVTHEDAVTANSYLTLSYPTVKKTILRTRLILFFYLIGLTLLMAVLVRRPGAKVLVLGFGIIISILVPFLMSIWHRSATKKSMKGVFRDLPTNTYYCEHELTILHDGLERSNRLSRVWLAWDAIDRLEQTNDFCFVHAGPTLTFFIPKDRILEGGVGAFWRELNVAWEENRTPKLDPLS